MNLLHRAETLIYELCHMIHTTHFYFTLAYTLTAVSL